MLRAALERAGLDVVAETDSWERCERLARRTRPEVLMVELWSAPEQLPQLRRLRASHPRALLVVMSVLLVEDLRAAVDGTIAADLLVSKVQPVEAAVGAVAARARRSAR